MFASGVCYGTQQPFTFGAPLKFGMGAMAQLRPTAH
jgi:hypothetical protein